MNRPAHLVPDRGDARIAEIAGRLDRLLRNQVPDERFVRSLRSTVQEWSQAIWSTAESLGASIPPPAEFERGLKLSQRPVFVCGLARSGTTLLRDLLDGHPELVAIPNESGFYINMQRALFDLRSDRQCSYVGRRWIEKLAARPPFWLLGSSDEAPYVAFARDYAGWWQVPERCKDARISSWPLAAFALAFAQRLGAGTLPHAARMWVEKTPGNERFVSRMWHDFPAAKVIQIVRRPEAVLASLKRMTPRQLGRRRTTAHVIREMAPGYRIAAASIDRLPKDRYCLIRYEDLTADPDAVMLRIARFLGIEPLPSLLLPTAAGRPAANNSSFGTSRPALDDILDPVDRALLALATGRHAAKLGYGRNQPSSAAGHAIVGSRA